MRKALGLFLTFLAGAAAGGLVVAVAARRMAAAWDGHARLFDALDRVALSAAALSGLERDGGAPARAELERELERALTEADRLAGEGARAPLIPLGADRLIVGLASAQQYVGKHGLDPALAKRASDLRAGICARLSPNSKYRGGCD